MLLSFRLPCLRAPNSNRNNRQHQLLLWLVVVCRCRYCLVLLLLWPSQQEQYHRGSVDTTVNKQPITIQWQVIYHALVWLLFRLVVVNVLLFAFVVFGRIPTARSYSFVIKRVARVRGIFFFNFWFSTLPLHNTPVSRWPARLIGELRSTYRLQLRNHGSATKAELKQGFEACITPAFTHYKVHSKLS